MKKVYSAIAIAVALGGCASTDTTNQISKQQVINIPINQESTTKDTTTVEVSGAAKGESVLYSELTALMKQDFDKRNIALDIKNKRAIQEIEEWSVNQFNKQLAPLSAQVTELRDSLQKVSENPSGFTSDEAKLVSLNLEKAQIEFDIKSIELEIETRIQKQSLLLEQLASYNNEKVKILNWYNNNIEMLVLRGKLLTESSVKLKELRAQVDVISNQIQLIETAELGWESND